jgi:hypothetical protein
MAMPSAREFRRGPRRIQDTLRGRRVVFQALTEAVKTPSPRHKKGVRQTQKGVHKKVSGTVCLRQKGVRQKGVRDGLPAATRVPLAAMSGPQQM